MSAKDHLPYDVLDLDGLRDDFAAGRVRQVGVVARRLLATLDAVLSSQGMVRASRPREAGKVETKPEVVCLCGSTRFIDTFQAEYGRLTDEGKIVLTVGRVVPQSEQALGSTRKVALDALHLRKIDLADRVLVLNVGGYVGPSTRREIAYAKECGKPIDLLYPDAGLDGLPPPVAPEACPRCPACGATEWFNIYSYKSTDGQGHPLKVWTDSAGDGDRAECRDKWHVEEREIEGIVERTIQKIPAMLATPASAAGREGAHGPGKCLSVDAVEFDRTVASREQDEREVWIRADERKRCEKAARRAGLVDYGTANQFDALCQQRDKCADAVRALLAAEAEGGWES